jgi:hypothetical protein
MANQAEGRGTRGVVMMRSATAIAENIDSETIVSITKLRFVADLPSIVVSLTVARRLRHFEAMWCQLQTFEGDQTNDMMKQHKGYG